MESDLISKKELLELTKISYGQLYRWKRKNLIPEDWFIRKSTFTGQETFFPKEKILDRIDKIKNMKGNISLDELANMLSPNFMEISMSKNQLIQQNIVSKNTIDFYTGEKGEKEGYAFEKILYLNVLDNMFQSGKINFEEGKIILNLLEEDYPKYNGKNCELLFIRKLGISSCCLISNTCEIYFENGIKIIERLSLSDLLEELKIKMV
ncbi:YhbD family protein [Methanobacterium sp. VT]|uniref:YhbD family protein n=2 Tax=Methanobacterium spitsbergense TaxID=2874285 RepID=A0A8T5UTB3_9EURY|nr:YhbD family protein [Methanobacterium spitsbergense]